jgi:hypothetical protein
MSIATVITEILILDRETAIHEIGQLKQAIDAKEFRSAAKSLDKRQLATLKDISESEVNRRHTTSYEGFRLGDKVSTTSYNSLVNLELTIVEFADPWVVCVKPSGSYTPALVVDDLVHYI